MSAPAAILIGALLVGWGAAPAPPAAAKDAGVSPVALTGVEREALVRIAAAEAADQGDVGLAAVILVVLNRLRTARWGESVTSVVDAPGQFEPVGDAGGSWRRLPEPDARLRARIGVVVSLAQAGALRDVTGGALYFQNPAIVAARAAAGRSPASRVRFGGRTPTIRIGAHEFFEDRRGGASQTPPAPQAWTSAPIFFPERAGRALGR